jgi:hypothetical protein
MKHFEEKIKRYREDLLEEDLRDNMFFDTIQKSKQAFSEYEVEHSLSYSEFLYQQLHYIKKQWWLLQGGILFLLWVILQISDSNFYIQRSMGILVPLFVMLIVPELWKNRRSSSMEIECTTFYSLRQIYSARMFLFAIVDMLLLSIFFIAVSITGSLTIGEFFINFFIPFNVTCCICFRTLCSPKIGSEYIALLLCVAWTSIWLLILQNEHIYNTFVLPIWVGLLLISFVYLVHCIRKACKNYEMNWEVNPSWN